jgi:hypothetical protein
MNACDPGMTIRQKELPSGFSGDNVSSKPKLAIHIATRHPLIGETWYTSTVAITNLSEIQVTITNVELVTRDATYQGCPPQTGTLPMSVAPGQTENLDVRFELAESVKKAFAEQAELRTHYRVRSQEEIVRTGLIGGALN